MEESPEYLDVKILRLEGGKQVLPAFRKEFSDLRQREIERGAAVGVVRRARRWSRLSAAAAIHLHRLADRLEPSRDLPLDRGEAVIRQP
jgi:hypothetical protein